MSIKAAQLENLKYLKWVSQGLGRVKVVSKGLNAYTTLLLPKLQRARLPKKERECSGTRERDMGIYLIVSWMEL
jgi:hypothetical protein